MSTLQRVALKLPNLCSEGLEAIDTAINLVQGNGHAIDIIEALGELDYQRIADLSSVVCSFVRAVNAREPEPGAIPHTPNRVAAAEDRFKIVGPVDRSPGSPYHDPEPEPIEGFTISPSGSTALMTGRRQWRVECIHCGETVHEATTGVRFNAEMHRRDCKGPERTDAEALFDEFAEFTPGPPSAPVQIGQRVTFRDGDTGIVVAIRPNGARWPYCIETGLASDWYTRDAFTISPAAPPPPTAAVHSSTDSDPRTPSSRERAPVPPPPAPDRAAPPAPQDEHDDIDVHTEECNTKRGTKFFCDCGACDGHGRECARWEGFDLCDCSLSDDPYKERRSARFPERKVEPSTFLCDHCNTVSGPHHSCDCGQNQLPEVCSLPAVGRRLAVHIKTGSIDEVVAGAFEGVEHDGRWRVKLERRGVTKVEPGECMVCPESWRVG